MRAVVGFLPSNLKENNMRQWRAVVSFVVMIGLLGGVAHAADKDLVAWWKFDEGKGKVAVDAVSKAKDPILGNFRYMGGAKDSGVKFDGFTTRVVREAARAPRLKDDFTVEAWVAPQAYAFNWCAIVNQEEQHKKGYFFGIDDIGHVGLHVAVDGEWVEANTEATIPFMEKWSHIVGTFRKGTGLTVYIDGEVAASVPVEGTPAFSAEMDLQIGRNHYNTLMNPAALVRPEVNYPASYSFDGIIDEVKIYSRALSAEEVKQVYEASRPDGPPPLTWRKLPQLLTQPGRFGAYYVNLKFHWEWDNMWPVGPYPDIVVGFDQLPGKMVFWRGTNYNMNLITENGRWVGDQSVEGGMGARRGFKEVHGCCEHMSDKQNRYAHVRIIENHKARVVVHWRYALNDVQYRIASTDQVTGWGDWVDEYYYIYPDGIAVRYASIHGKARGYSITEPATFNQPGEKAEDNVELDAVTMANMKGQTRTYSWDPWPGSGKIAADFGNPLPGANIVVVNFKAEYRPFYVYEPDTRIIPYGGGLVELRSEYSHFPTWNHWPVSQEPSDGRFALVPDRVSSSAILSPEPPMTRRSPDDPMEARFIMGLVDQSIDKLVPLARSWLQAPRLRGVSAGFKNEGYSRDQRAYILRNETGQSAPLEFRIAASKNSPVVNPAFVIRDWGEAEAQLTINGKEIESGEAFRYGYHPTVEGTDLIVWIRHESMRPVRISITADK